MFYGDKGKFCRRFLFSIYLNDLEQYQRTNNVVSIDCTLQTDELFMYFNLFVLLYADDTVIFADSANNLQHVLNIFENYCTVWRLTVNIDKTKIMIFGRGKHKKLVFHFGSNPLEIVNIFKYLGVIFTRCGSFSKTIKHNTDQANKAMFLLLRKINRLNLSIDLQIELFDKMIKPILLYGCEVWGFSNITLIERVQLQFLKSIFNLKQSTPNIMIYGEFGGWSGGAMVLGKLPGPGRPTILITVGQGPIALAVGAGGGGLDIFTLIYPFSSFSLSLGDGPI